MWTVVMEGQFIGSCEPNPSALFVLVHQRANRMFATGKRARYEVFDKNNQKVSSGDIIA